MRRGSPAADRTAPDGYSRPGHRSGQGRRRGQLCRGCTCPLRQEPGFRDDYGPSHRPDPTPSSLEGAKRAWLRARDDYTPTEAFRFYGGPIDNEEDGPEGLLNAWPLDESYIDYVEGNAQSGIINNPPVFPVIDGALIKSLNEEGGEENVSTDLHAIEFLLWGQDMNEIGPGSRPLADYTTGANADRRGIYLAVASDLLLVHLQQMVDAWAPSVSGNYRAEFMAMDAAAALTNIITGIGELSRGELAGERMTVA